MMILLLILLWIAIILGFNIWDKKVTERGGKPEYLLYFTVRGFAAIVHGILMLMAVQDAKTYYSTLTGWELFVVWSPYLCFQVTSFWVIYESIRNLWTHHQVFYYDNVEKDSGYIDRFFAWAGWQFHLICKILALILCIFSVIVIYQR